MGLTLDTGALIAIERRKRRVGALIVESLAQGQSVTVPSAVLIEWWRGGRGEQAYRWLTTSPLAGAAITSSRTSEPTALRQQPLESFW